MSIIVKDVTKTFGGFKALDRVSVEVEDGTLLALLGPSGSGKTTLLRIIAGLEVADSGTVHNDGEDITEQTARERKVGFVFQHYALFRHMTVEENIGYGLRVRKRPKEQIRARVDELLRLIRLDNLGKRYPSQLSGGQRQRVALARALAAEPKVLLLDEPAAGVPEAERRDILDAIAALPADVSVLLIEHDMDLVFSFARRISVLVDGRLLVEGEPAAIARDPRVRAVYLGESRHG
jgi:sulfate transport system ATP-binding protein